MSEMLSTSIDDSVQDELDEEGVPLVADPDELVAWKPKPHRPLPPRKCQGIVRNGERQGERCNKWALQGGRVCLSHGGNLPNVRKHAQANVDAARATIFESAESAADTMVAIMENPETADALKFKIAVDILDRVGLKSSDNIEVNVTHGVDPANLLSERIAKLRSRTVAAVEDESIEDVNVVDGEVVDEVDTGDEVG